MTDSNIESILHENRSFPPPADFAANARITPAEFAALNTEAERDNVAFWARLARQELSWHTKFKQTLDDTQAPNYRWFADGMLNASYNCLDVHLAANGDKPAIIFEGEPGDSHTLTYRQLTAEVCRFANALKAQGIQPGDRIVIYMPMVPEAVIAMQACARIGATHSVVFGGFSANSLRDRINDASATHGDHRRRRLARRQERGTQVGSRHRTGGRLQDRREGHRAQAHRRTGHHAGRAATCGGQTW